MKKINNEGWGLGVMITFLGVFFVAIVMVVYISNKYDIGIKNTYVINEEKNNTNQNNYNVYETLIKEKAIIYQENYYPNISNNDKFYTNINNLDLDKEITNICSGYVEFGKNDDSYYYYPYIKCQNYKTKGYQSHLGN